MEITAYRLLKGRNRNRHLFFAERMILVRRGELLIWEKALNGNNSWHMATSLKKLLIFLKEERAGSIILWERLLHPMRYQGNLIGYRDYHFRNTC